MRDPQRLVDGNDHPELKRLLLAAKYDGPPPPAGAKKRVQAAVLAHMRARDEVRQSGIRRIGSVGVEQEGPSETDTSKSAPAQGKTRSWVDDVWAFFAIAAAFAVVILVARHAYVIHAEHAHPKAPSRIVDVPVPEKHRDSEHAELEEHRASMTIIEESGPVDEDEINVTEPEVSGPPHELVLRLKHRAHKYGTPQIVIRSSCSDPNDWLRNTEMDYPTDAYDAGLSGTMNVTCNLNPDGSFSGCVAQRPPGFTSGDTGKVLRTMNSWTLAQSMANWATRTHRCKIDLIFEVDGRAKIPGKEHR